MTSSFSRKKAALRPLTLIVALILTMTLTMEAGASIVAEVQQSASSQETRSLAGLRKQVNVRRDGRGIPYIEASNDADLYFAQGYVTASDRLWQMDLLRRTARGTLAEILGRSALEEDKRHRILGFGPLCDVLVMRLSPQVREEFEAYARGVNAFIDSCDVRSLPAEFGVLQYKPLPWKPADSLLIGKLLAEALSTSWQLDVMRAARADLSKELRDGLSAKVSMWDVPIVGSDNGEKSDRMMPPGARTGGDSEAARVSFTVLDAVSSIAQISARSLERAGLSAEQLAASNNWVVSGKHTESGKAMLANDPHLAPSIPSIWYLTHLSAPGLRVAGVTCPGAPGIILGHNDRIAWGATNLGADVQDLYIETFDKENKQRYLTPAGWRDAQVRREEIMVRKGPADPSTEAVTIDVTVTAHGPIVLEKDSTRYALRWVALDGEASEISAFYAVDRARNWKEFCAALRDFPGPSQNFVYADADGHIGYYGAGKIPVRKSGDGGLPYDGSKSDGDWTGFIAFESLPHLYDPSEGVIVTANNRVTGRDYQNHITSDWAPPYRARRISDLLRARQKLTVDDFRRIQGDVYSISGVAFAQRLTRIARPENPGSSDGGWRETIALLEAWDGQVKADSRVLPILSEIRGAFRRRVLTAALGPVRAEQASADISSTFIDYLITQQPREWLPKEFTSYDDLLRQCEKDAREALTRRFGSDSAQWKWSRIVGARFPHPLGAVPVVGEKFAIPPLTLDGSNGTFPTINVGVSVSMRLVAIAGDWDKTVQGIALGQSGDPASSHFTDQLEGWRTVNTPLFPFGSAAVATTTKASLVLAPKGR